MKKDPYAHLRTEKAMREALNLLKTGQAVGTVGTGWSPHYELFVSSNMKPIAIFDLRRCINDRPGLKGIKKVLAPRRRR